MGETAGVRVMLSEPRKAIPLLAAPLVVTLIVQNLNSVVDVLWVSWLGGNAISSLGLVYPIYAALIGVGSGLGVGVAAAEARAIGRGDREGANRIASQSFTVAVFFAVVASPLLIIFAEPLMRLFGAGEVTGDALAYGLPLYAGLVLLVLSPMMSGILRGEGGARQSMYIQVASAITNIVLDPLLIYTCHMGVAGAAWATVVAAAVPVFLGLLIYHRGHMYLSLRLQDLRPDLTVQRNILSVGLPQSAEYVVMSLFNVPMNIAIIHVGGTDAVGIYTTAWRIAYMALVPAEALSGAVVSVCSAEAATGRLDLFRDAFRYGVHQSFRLTAYLSLVMAVCSWPLAWVFVQAPDLLYLRTEMFVIIIAVAILMPVMSWVFTCSAYLQALKRSVVAFASSLIRNIMMASAYIAMAYLVGTLLSIWVAMVLVELVGGSLMFYLALVCLRRAEVRQAAGTTA